MNLSDFHFIRPFWLLALVPLVAVLVMGWKNKLMQGNWNQVCDQELLPYILQERTTRQNRWPFFSAALAGFLAIIALAGPSWERLPSPVFRNAAALVIVLDLSRSMDAPDITPSRLIRARYKIADILRRRKDGQTALIVYAGDAFTVTPLTEDVGTIASQLSALTTEIMPVLGSNAAAALQKAVALFKQAGLTSGGILLVTDGVITEDVMPEVRSLGQYKLSILGVGTEQGAPIKTPDGGFLKDIAGNIVVPKLIPQDLKNMAKAGGGIYRTMSPDDSDIEALLTTFDSQVQQQAEEKTDLLLDLWLDRGPWLLFLIVPLAALNFRRGIVSLIFCLLLPIPKASYALEWQNLWQTKDQQGQKNFQHEQYKQAAEQFSRPAWKGAAYYKAGEYGKSVENFEKIQTSDGFFNKGNALAKMGKLQEAIQAYQQALKLDPKHQDALYNKKLVEKELEKQKQQSKKQQSKKQQDKSSSEKNQDQQNKSSQQDQKQQNQEQQDSQSSEQKKEQQSQSQESEQNKSSNDQHQDNQQDRQQQDQKQQKQQPVTENSKQQAQPLSRQQDQKKANEKKNQAATEVNKEQNEQQQADEQWLQRIPDDPSGLLRRKFLYQYGRRKNRSENSEAW